MTLWGRRMAQKWDRRKRLREKYIAGVCLRKVGSCQFLPPLLTDMSSQTVRPPVGREGMKKPAKDHSEAYMDELVPTRSALTEN